MNYFVSLEIVTCYPKISLCVKNPSCSPTLSLIKLQLNSNFTVSVPTADEMGFFVLSRLIFTRLDTISLHMLMQFIDKDGKFTGIAT